RWDTFCRGGGGRGGGSSSALRCVWSPIARDISDSIFRTLSGYGSGDLVLLDGGTSSVVLISSSTQDNKCDRRSESNESSEWEHSGRDQSR
ncbi:hypothetical protein PFISCL1PPCAC_24347, partial [Pristionchus fissidentatus]